MRLVILLALVACAPDPVDTGTAPVPPWLVDDDGDAYSADVDCDDTDAGVHPGANERCDGLDQDCDGEADEEAVDAVRWYTDDDGDGAGDRYGFLQACDPVPGRIEAGGDCDDGDAAVHPDAAELCNGVDDDCDGETDEGDLPDEPTWYRDADADGYGNPGDAVIVCAAPEGYVADATDCDDADGAVSPAGVETCDDVDEDCDGEVDEDAVDAYVFYADLDDDSYGDAGVTMAACRGSDGWIARLGDCDDTDATVSPRGEETCDGVDEDCDGEIDEDAVDAEPWYVDADGDGYGAPDSTFRACGEPADGADNPRDCDDTDPTVTLRHWYADVDGDGFGNPSRGRSSCEAPSSYVADATDCDDADATAYPGASEWCDGADDDCDGAVDEEAVDESRWFADGDGDGFGDAAVVATACEAPDGYLADGTDCDDGEAATWPDAPERCDAADNDCDGAVDEDAEDAATWFADADGDGFGDASLPATACDAPDGYVADAGDCADGDGDVHPDVEEVCGDGIDDDCDGADAACPAFSGEVDIGDVYGARVTGASDRYVGLSLAHAGDVDGDGLGDFVVGVPTSQEAWLFAGGATGELDEEDAVAVVDSTASESLGCAVAGNGDLDGDGLAEVAVGAESGGFGAGRVLVLGGGWSGVTDASEAAWIFTGEDDTPFDLGAADDYAGGAVAGVGDLDGDGLPDLAVGALRGDGGAGDDGVVYIVYGGRPPGAWSLADMDGVFAGTTVWGATGSAVAGVGDTDGDGLDDLLIGGNRHALVGAAWLLLGPAGGARGPDDADAAFLGEEGGAGSYVAGAGDTDGDGRPELLVGAPTWGAAAAGAAYLLRGPFGGSSSLVDAAIGFYGDSGDYLGPVAGLGDIDLDGFDDIAIGVPYGDAAATNGGAVRVRYGGDGGREFSLVSRESEGGVGNSLPARAPGERGDLTGDGVPDLLVGTRAGTGSRGAVVLVPVP